MNHPPVQRVCNLAGIAKLGWKELRHTFASHLVVQGVPLKAVQELLGHANIEMTMRYARPEPIEAGNADTLMVCPGKPERRTEDA